MLIDMFATQSRISPLFIVAVLLAACFSSAPQSAGPKANIPQPEFAIEQAFGPADAAYPYGALEVKYRFEILNRADVPLTLKRITISTINPEGGAYTLPPPHDYYFNKNIPAKASEVVEFWAKAFAYGRSIRDSEPVTVKGVAYFQSPAGYLNQVFVRELEQMR